MHVFHQCQLHHITCGKPIRNSSSIDPLLSFVWSRYIEIMVFRFGNAPKLFVGHAAAENVRDIPAFTPLVSLILSLPIYT